MTVTAIQRVETTALLLPGVVTPTALILPETLEQPAWLAVGDQLQHAERSLQWWMGDWYNFGFAKWGDLAAAGVAPESAQSLLDIAWVSGKFQTSRRREDLTFSHHREVAALPEPDADRLMNEAGKHGWSTRELREHARKVKNKGAVGPPPAPATTIRRCVGCNQELLGAFHVTEQGGLCGPCFRTLTPLDVACQICRTAIHGKASELEAGGWKRTPGTPFWKCPVCEGVEAVNDARWTEFVVRLERAGEVLYEEALAAFEGDSDTPKLDFVLAGEEQ